jgi:hypothetical protein
MNAIIKIITALLFLTLQYGCAVLQKGTSYFGEERVFGKHFNNTYNTIYREAQNWEPAWELGVAFKPIKDGRIKAIRIKNPTKGQVRLSIWDADTRALLSTNIVTISDTVNYNKFIIELPITANKIYCTTINVRKYYYYNLPFDPLPLNTQDVSLLYSVYEETPYQRFPQQNVSSVYHGIIDLDMDFKTK